MDALALMLAAVEEAEPSKTAFYVAGGLLAVFAVLISVLGFTRPDFPASGGAARGVMGLSAVLVVAAMTATVLTS